MYGIQPNAIQRVACEEHVDVGEEHQRVRRERRRAARQRYTATELRVAHIHDLNSRDTQIN